MPELPSPRCPKDRIVALNQYYCIYLVSREPIHDRRYQCSRDNDSTLWFTDPCDRSYYATCPFRVVEK